MRNMKKSTIMNTLKKKIREHKYKFTTQRQIILQAFLDSKENHMSAEDVYEWYGTKIPTSVWPLCIVPWSSSPIWSF